VTQMKARTWIYLRPLGPVAFRWGGTTSPLLRGTAAHSLVSPLPLPSTVSGFLRAQLMRMGKLEPEEALREDSLRGLGIELGPVLLLLRFERGSVPCAFIYGARGPSLLCASPGGSFAISPRVLYRVGVALEADTRSALEGYLYSMEHLDLSPVALRAAGGGCIENDIGEMGALRSVGIAVGIQRDEGGLLPELRGVVGPLGGEGVPAIIEGEVDLELGDGVPVLAAPALIDGYGAAGLDLRVVWDGGAAVLRGYAASARSCWPPESPGQGKDGEVHARPTVRLLSRGFALNSRLPMSLAAMPGPAVDCDCAAIGRLTWNGWGSVVRLPLRLRDPGGARWRGAAPGAY